MRRAGVWFRVITPPIVPHEVDRDSVTVVGMPDAPTPDSVFTFEFDPSGSVSALTIGDRWSQVVELEEFGWALLLAYAEQHATAAAGVATVEAGGDPDNVRYPRELRDDVLDLARDVSRMLQGLASYEPEPPEPVEVSDRHRHVVIEAVGGVPNRIAVDEGWLRKADLADVEADVVAAFRAMAAEAPRDALRGELGGLRERLAGIVARRNDFSKE